MNFRLYKTTECRKGVTLIEMLVVVAIMMMMLAMATPLFQSNGAERIPRETARALTSYLQDARAKAISTGRPCGVALLPFANYPTACVVAQLVETPPLYTGETYNSTVTVKGKGSNNLSLSFKDAKSSMTQEGNLIRLGSRGLWYEMTGANGCKLQSGQEDDPNEKFRPWTDRDGWTTTYEIQAQPVSQANGYLQSIGMEDPLKVPRGGAIDLIYSGAGDSGQFNNSSKSPVVILFSANGDVCQLIQSNSRSVPTEKIYILCGQWERSLGETFKPEDGLWNYETMDNFYVVIDPASGTSKAEQIINGSGGLSSSRQFTSKASK